MKEHVEKMTIGLAHTNIEYGGAGEIQPAVNVTEMPKNMELMGKRVRFKDTEWARGQGCMHIIGTVKSIDHGAAHLIKVDIDERHRLGHFMLVPDRDFLEVLSAEQVEVEPVEKEQQEEAPLPDKIEFHNCLMVFAPGSRVSLQGELSGTVLKAIINPNDHVQYSVSWWNGRSYEEKIVEAFEVRSVVGTIPKAIGFHK